MLNYAGNKGIIIQLTQNAWDYSEGLENATYQVVYLNDTLPYILSLPNVIGSISFPFISFFYICLMPKVFFWSFLISGGEDRYLKTQIALELIITFTLRVERLQWVSLISHITIEQFCFD